MPTLATRFHIELDLDMVCPPSDVDVKRIIYDSLDSIKFVRYHKCRNVKIKNQKKQQISNGKHT